MVCCIFCNIVKKESPARIIYEDEFIMAFLDASPLSKGHTLVIPKQHYATLLDISNLELTQLMTKIQFITTNLLNVLKVTDFNLLQNNGPSASQAVHHLHFHIIPRPPGSLSWLHNNAVKRINISDALQDELCLQINQNYSSK
ncbi:histidine triad protein [Pilaira anomala]|nr:histidine triad protein [Pilaira anomala]